MQLILILKVEIFNQLAGHFLQFLIFKDAAYGQFDYSNFDQDGFMADFFKIRWNENKDISRY